MNICLVSANDVMEHFAYPGSIDFAADDQGAFSHVLFMKGCCIYSSSVKLCLPSANDEQFPMQMTQNCKHSSGCKSSPRKIVHRNSSGERRLKFIGERIEEDNREAERTRRQRRQDSDHKSVQRQRQNTTITL